MDIAVPVHPRIMLGRRPYCSANTAMGMLDSRRPKPIADTIIPKVPGWIPRSCANKGITGKMAPTATPTTSVVTAMGHTRGSISSAISWTQSRNSGHVTTPSRSVSKCFMNAIANAVSSSLVMPPWCTEICCTSDRTSATSMCPSPYTSSRSNARWNSSSLKRLISHAARKSAVNWLVQRRIFFSGAAKDDCSGLAGMAADAVCMLQSVQDGSGTEDVVGQMVPAPVPSGMGALGAVQ
mmetsp:Transcript_10914/g.19439  ORF Transcript_10914/g.19439 Transcript_10914/m.19439 type:complete len:238 (+) Transcript_10914:1134-1847(+)